MYQHTKPPREGTDTHQGQMAQTMNKVIHRTHRQGKHLQGTFIRNTGYGHSLHERQETKGHEALELSFCQQSQLDKFEMIKDIHLFS